MSAPGRPLAALAALVGGWGRLLLLALAVAGVGAGLLWERWRHPPVPPGAAQVAHALNVDIRQTTYRHPGPEAALRAFYRAELPPRGWRYCGTQATPACTNLTALLSRPPDAVDVYRRPGDGGRGATVEVWPISTTDGGLFVTVYETRGG